MIFADLRRHIAFGLDQICQRRIFRVNSLRGAGHADRRQARPHRKLPGDEGGSACRAARLGIAVGQQDSLTRDTIDVGRRPSHDAAMVGAYVEPA
jgi:hypothetical protein